MAKRPPKPPQSKFKLDPAKLQQMTDIGITIKGRGFVTRQELDAEFGERPVTEFIAIAFRDYRMLREARRPVGPSETALGYEWADRRFSKQEIAKVPDEVGWVLSPLLTTPGGPRYTDYRHAIFTCRWTNHVLASKPVPGVPDQRMFERVNGAVVIPSYCPRAMFLKALPKIGKTQALAFQLGLKAIRIPLSEVEVTLPELSAPKQPPQQTANPPQPPPPRKGLPKILLPVVDEKTHEGKGLTEYESLPPGTLFRLEVWYPASEISTEDLIRVVGLASEFVRLSPARSAGYGDFEVLTINGDPLQPEPQEAPAATEPSKEPHING